MDIIPILEEFTGEQLGDNGPAWRSMKCPFHKDTRPSARYNSQAFLCNGCGVKGDAIAVLRQVEGLTYAKAVARAEEILARRGQNLPRKSPRESRRKPFAD